MFRKYWLLRLFAEERKAINIVRRLLFPRGDKCRSALSQDHLIPSLDNFGRKVLKLTTSLILYSEKILVPKTKPYITFQGAGARRTILSWGDTTRDFEVYGTSRSASTAVEADHFIAKEITFRVSYMPEGQTP